MSFEARLKTLNLALPHVHAPTSNYANAVLSGRLLFLSGQAPYQHEGDLPKGQIGRDVSVEEGIEHARSVALGLLAVARAELGSLDRISRVVRVFGLELPRLRGLFTAWAGQVSS